MDNAINNFFINAQLSMAAYATLNISMNDNLDDYKDALIAEGFSYRQAEDFTKTYEILSQIEDPVSGLSATAFRNGDETFLAIRGTETDSIWGVLDVISDIQIAEGVNAPGQLNALETFYSSLVANGDIKSSDTVNVTGHSLGGFLAQMFAVNHAGEIGETFTYNAPGLGGIGAQILDLMGVAESNVPAASITNIRGAGLSPIATLGTLLGDIEEVFIESSLEPFSNHSIRTLTDALAVYDLLAHVDPARPAEPILALGRDILEAASNEAEASLEAVVNGLGKIFRAGVNVAVDDRDQLYTNIHAIREALPETASHQLVNLVRVGPDDLRARAAADTPEGLAYRYALQNLLPFAVLGDPGLYDRQALAAEHFSQDYLTDRAGALGIILQSNLGDRAAVRRGGRHARVGTDFIDHDADGGTTTLARIAGRSQGGARTRQVRFGSDAGETLYGGGEADRLYGGAGDDTLYGSAPGADDGKPDRLEGGAGDDTYHARRGDVILDTDRRGTIYLNGISLAGDYRREGEDAGGARLYRHATRAITLTVADGRAVFSRRDGSVTVEAFDTETQPFADGDFGISLAGSEEPDSNGLNIVDGTDGDESLTAGTELNGDAGDDLIRGFAGDDDLYGRRGRDILEGGIGTDYLNSSAFLDGTTLFPDDPGDWLFGGDGDDIVIGNGGDDRLFGGDDSGRDFLSGRSGDDFLDGGPGDDVLSGGSGSDRLMGGDGDDILLGDFDIQATPNRDWSVTPILNERGHIVDYDFQNVLFTAGDADDAADVIHGGAGNDYINGNRGDDLLRGNAGHDTILGCRGDDTLYGGSGDDVLYGDSAFQIDDAAGDDTIHGGDGDDEIFGEGGNDRLYGDAGNDFLWGGDGDDSLYGGTGQDELTGGDGDDQLFGGDDDDRLFGDEGNDYLDGGAGDDMLSGGAGSDTLIAGSGDDLLDGGGGNDSYFYGRGNGHDVIRDSDGHDRLHFTDGIRPEEIALTVSGDDLILALDAENSVTLENGASDPAIDVITFADDRVLTPATLSDPGLAGYLSIADDQSASITGTAGDDYLIAEAASSMIDGGSGNDLYVVTGTVETLTITDGGGTDTLLSDRHLDAGNISGTVGNGVLEADFDGVTVRVNNWLDNPLERFVFADGAELDRADIDAFLDYSPVRNKPIETDAPVINQPFEYQIPADLFVDPITGEELTYQVSSSGSSGWLSYDAPTRTLSGTPGYRDIGSVQIEITARDSSFREGNTIHTLDVLPPVDGYAVFHPGTIDGSNGTHLAIAGYSDDPQSQLDPRFHAIGDISGDGIDDLLVETNAGRAHVVFGRSEDLGETINFLDLDGTNGYVVEHEDAGRNVRAGLDEPEFGVHRGDFNGDGITDLLLEATGVPAEAGYDREGYVIFGGGDTASALLTLGEDSATGITRITGNTDDPSLPTFGAVSDYNGDGIDDIRFLDKVIYGRADLPAQVDADNLEPEAGRELAYAATDIGDMNGDGLSDYYLLEHSAVLFGVGTGLPEAVDVQTLDGNNGFRLSSSGGAIASVAGIGDFNGDGLADLAAGVPEDDWVSILYGRDDGFDADIDLTDLTVAEGLVVTGGLQGSLGDTIAPAGDVNGDGFNDVVISQSGFVSGHIDALVLYGTEETPNSPQAAGEIGPDRGFFARSDGYSFTSGSIHGLGMGDINGDGYDDIQVTGGNGERYLAYGRLDRSATVLFGTAGDDTLSLEGQSLAVYSGDGADTVFIDNLDRPARAPVIEIHGGNGADTVVLGSPGNPLNPADPEAITAIDIHGGSGDDEYVINGDNVFVTIHDDGRTAGNNVLSFGEHYRLKDILLTQNEAREFVIRFSNNQTAIRLDPDNFIPWLVDTGPRAIGEAKFADGTVLTYDQLIARGFDHIGSADNEFFNGTNMTDRMYGGAGVDRLFGGGGDDYLYGEDDDDVLFGDAGNDRLYGGAGDDYLDGYWGDDYLEGGPGDDYMEGGIGNDVYSINRGDGNDMIREVGGIDVLEFGPDISPGSLFLDTDGNDLVIQLSDSDFVTINGFFHNTGSGLVEFFRFADGTLLTAEELLEAQFESTTLLGSDGDDMVTVSGRVSHVYTGLGDDSVVINGEDMLGQKRLQVSTGAGNDVIEYRGAIASGSGARPPRVTMEGGPGDDRYIIRGNQGNVTISDVSVPGAGNSVVFGEGYSSSNVRLGLGSLLLDFGDDRVEVHLDSFDPNDVLGGPRTVETFEFADGSVLSYEELVARGFDIEGTHTSDELTGTNLDDRIRSYDGDDVLAGGAGDDLLEGGSGFDTYIYNTGDGRDVIFDTGGFDTVRFGEGIMPEPLRIGRDGDDLVIDTGEATGEGLVVQRWFDNSSDFRIEQFQFADGTVAGADDLVAANQPPVQDNPLPDISTEQDAEFSYTIPVDSFSDPDGDALAFEATLADGASLPEWLNFDADSGVLSGTPDNDDVGTYEVQITAADAEGESVTDSLTLTVVNVNDTPEVIVPLTDQVTDEDALFSLVLPEDTFSDPDLIHGDELTLSATQAAGDSLPAWLSFDPATLTLTGTPENADVGDYAIEIMATDLAGASATTPFNLTVNNVNDTPLLNHPIEAAAAYTKRAFTHTLPEDTFTDADTIHGDMLTLTASRANGDPLPDWLSFDAATGTFSGTPRIADYGNLELQVTATDREGANATDSFTLAIDSQARLIEGNNRRNVLIGRFGDDLIYGKSGNDLLIGLGGDDILLGGTGNDKLLAIAGENLLDGGSGDDSLVGGFGRDTLRGGRGNDSLNGGFGDDTYIFSNGDGNDVITEPGGHDRLIFEGIEEDQLSFRRAGFDLNININNSDDSVTIKRWYLGSHNQVESIETSSGHQIDIERQTQLLTQSMSGFGVNSLGNLNFNRLDDNSPIGMLAATISIG